MKKLLGIFFLLPLFFFSTCAGDSADGEVIRILLNGNKPADFDSVYDDYLRRTGDTLNIRLDITFVDPGDYRERLVSELSSRRPAYDLVFDAPRFMLVELAGRGLYADLRDEIDFIKFPNILKAHSPNVLESNLINGHMYHIPLFRGYGSGIPVIFYRQDWADAWGIGTISNLEMLERYWELAGDRDILPIFLHHERGFGDFLTYAGHHTAAVRAGIRGFSIAGHLIMVHVQDNTIAEIAPAGSGDEAFAAFPPPFNRDFAMDRFEQFAQWRRRGFLDDPSPEESGRFFNEGRSASLIGTLGDAVNLRQTMIDPDAAVGYFIYDNDIRNFRSAAMPNCLIMNNGLAIPAGSDRKQDTIRFLDWLFSDAENHNLFELGIEGIHYSFNPDGTFHAITDYPNRWPGNSLTWNNFYTVLSDQIRPEDRPWYEYEMQESSILWLPVPGFLFDTRDPFVAAGIANLDSASHRVLLNLRHGLMHDGNRSYTSAAQMMQANMDMFHAAGLDQLQGELERQLIIHLRH